MLAQASNRPNAPDPSATHRPQNFRGWFTRLRGACLALSLLSFSWVATAQHDASIFRDADIGLGEKLIAENRCTECHIRKFGGNGTSIYRPQGRINTAGFLRGMVEQCNTELKLQLFPEEVTAIAAVLNRDFYRFK